MRTRGLLRIAQIGIMQLALISSAAIAKVSIDNDGRTTTTRVQIEGITLGTTTLEKSNFATMKLQGADGYDAIDYQIGKPQIPVVRFYVNGEPTITFGPAESNKSIKSRLKVVPNQPARVKKPDQKNKLVIDEAFYQIKSAKKAPFSVTPAGSINGNKRYLVTLFPVQYDPTSSTYSLIANFEIKAKNSTTTVKGNETFAFVVGAQFHNNSALLNYAALKEQLGYKVEFINVTAQDTPATIRASIQALYNKVDTDLKHALIIGDLADVPSHESSVIAGVTDHYYRAIDTTDYLTDINGPDIGVGRVSVANAAQLETVLAKFTRYTQGQFSSEQWLRSVSFIATDDQYQVAEGSHNYAIQTYTEPAQYAGVFPQANMPGGDQLYAITHRVPNEKVVEVMGLGRTIIDYSGHGSTYSWAGPNVSQDDVRSLTDPNALPFVISNACITGDFRADESFGETWQRHGAGAIMFWGSMDSTYWEEDDILERAMFDGIYRDGLLSFQNITNHALAEHWRHYGGQGKAPYYWETYVIFGDPSLELRTTETKNIAVNGPSVLPVGVGTVSFNVSENGAPLSGVRVALTVPGRSLSYVAISNADGVAEFNIEAASREVVTFKVTAYGQNAKLSAGELRIVPADNPYLSFSEIQANGRVSSNVYLNETVTLGAQVANLGQRPTTGAVLEVSSIEGAATLISDNTRIPPLAARAQYRISDAGVQFKIHADANAGDPVKLNMKWTTDEGETSEFQIPFRVLKAGIEVTSIDFGGTGSEGGIAPGTEGDVFLTIKNTGNEVITTGSIFGTAGACADNVTGTIPMMNLEPGKTLRLASPLSVSVSSTCHNGDTVELAIQGSYTSAATTIALAGEATFLAGIMTTAERESANINLEIPDDGDFVEHAINVDINGVIKDLGVHIRATHPYIGDLTVDLVHPDGTSVRLHSGEGGSDDNIDHVYGFGGTPVADLTQLAGKSAMGTWKVVVQDHAAQDSGTLDYVKITVRGFLN